MEELGHSHEGVGGGGSSSRFRTISTATTSWNSEECDIQFLYLSKALHEEVRRSSLMKNGLEGEENYQGSDML